MKGYGIEHLHDIHDGEEVWEGDRAEVWHGPGHGDTQDDEGTVRAGEDHRDCRHDAVKLTKSG